jgi:hypothetical protein
MEPELSPQLFMPAAGRDAAETLEQNKKARRLIVASPWSRLRWLLGTARGPSSR